MKKTVSFRMVLGVNEGYGSHTSNAIDAEAVAEAYKEASAELFSATGVYISASMVESKTLYHTDWGCPVGGEATATFFGSCNPEFTDVAQYREIVTALAKILKKQFTQSTVTVEFFESEMVYLAD